MQYNKRWAILFLLLALALAAPLTIIAASANSPKPRICWLREVGRFLITVSSPSDPATCSSSDARDPKADGRGVVVGRCVNH